MRDLVYVVGHGKLASKIQNELLEIARKHHVPIKSVDNWDNFSILHTDFSRTVFFHAGSGKQLRDVLACCQNHQIPLIQTSTGMIYPENLSRDIKFVLVEAPNLSIPVIKFMSLLEKMGTIFREYDISIIESHQEKKRSIPVATLTMAKSLTLNHSQIASVRDKQRQQLDLGIPSEYLDQHSLHIIDITADKCKISLKTEVYGLETCLLGLISLVRCLEKMSPGKYKLEELIQQNLL